MLEVSGFHFSMFQNSIQTVSEKKNKVLELSNNVNRVVEFPGAGLGRLITINSELNGAI